VSAADDLLELAERVGAAERSALAAKWKDREGVESPLRSVSRSIEERRDLDRRTALDGGATSASSAAPQAGDATAVRAE